MSIVLPSATSHYLYKMLVKTRGIVLRSLKYGDTSLIVDIYCRELGMQSYILNGARKPRSSMPAGLFQVMSILDVVAYHSEKSTLKRLKEATPAIYYSQLQQDIRRSSTGIFLVELLRNTLPQTESHPDLYDFVEDVFIRLDTRQDDLPVYVLRVMLLLSARMGFQPGGKFSTEEPFFDLMNGVFRSTPPSHPHYLLPETAVFLGPLIEDIEITSVPEGLDNTQRRKLLTALLDYYRLHLPHFSEPKSQAILHQVFAI